MRDFGDLPAGALVLVALLVASVLLMQHVGWLLWATAMLDRRKQPPPTPRSRRPSVMEEPDAAR